MAHVSVWLAAHPDDCLVFRGQRVYQDLRDPTNLKMVFIYLTAGDAGRADCWWQGRELGGAVLSVLRGLPRQQQVNWSYTAINGHNLMSYNIGTAITCYCLRLPDGNWDSDMGRGGYEIHNYESLAKLRSGTISCITAIDRSSIYRGWDDLERTARAILDSELEGWADEVAVRINASDYDHQLNPGDHWDHYAAGLLASHLASDGHYNQSLFVGYDCANRQPNLTASELKQKSVVFSGYADGLKAFGSLLGANFVDDYPMQRWGPYDYHRELAQTV